MVTKMSSTRRNTALILLLVVVLIASQEKTNMVVGEQGDSCVETNEGPQPGKCWGKCFRPGKCNECCKQLGFVRGKCSNLACYCCQS
ncbi:unnamed protein product [Urochloa decumbens]|uniref:Uncharacterized protein n=1 Tax=Urochloa decumbens TaxID=240449 RepID=A0ABC9CQR0_9POAL